MDITITGSIAFDYLMNFPGNFKDHILPEHLERISLSFLVDSMSRLRGGVAPNIAYTLALLGERPRLWATVGEDFEEYRRVLENAGVDTSGVKVIPGEFTASFFVNTDRANAQIASFYPGAMAHACKHSLHDLKGNLPGLVVISPNDPGAMTCYVNECREMGVPFVYDPSQQLVRLSAEDVKRGLAGALALFVNDYEFALIEKMTGFSVQAILQDSEAGDGVFVVVTPECIVDPTGVGDAFRGGFLKGYALGLDWETCGRMGSLAATYCLEKKGTQGHKYTPEEFVARYRRHFDDQGKLDRIIVR